MRHAFVIASVLVAAATAVPAAAEDSARGVGAYGSFFAQLAPKTPAPLVRSNPLTPARAAAPAVLCGLTLLPADPTFDSKIKRIAPDAKRFPMKIAKPSICTR